MLLDSGIPREHRVGRYNGASRLTVRNLIWNLGSKDRRTRENARLTLTRMGSPAVEALMEALIDPSWQVRWEAAKSLADIHDPVSAPALVQTLEDKQSGIRWLAAVGLIAMGREGLAPLMEALMACSGSTWLREGAHHILHDLAARGLREWAAPVLAALEDVEPAVAVPPAAQAALCALMEPAR